MILLVGGELAHWPYRNERRADAVQTPPQPSKRQRVCDKTALPILNSTQSHSRASRTGWLLHPIRRRSDVPLANSPCLRASCTYSPLPARFRVVKSMAVTWCWVAAADEARSIRHPCNWSTPSQMQNSRKLRATLTTSSSPRRLLHIYRIPPTLPSSTAMRAVINCCWDHPSPPTLPTSPHDECRSSFRPAMNARTRRTRTTSCCV